MIEKHRGSSRAIHSLRSAARLAVLTGAVLAGEHARAEAQVVDLGTVDVLGRTFSCPLTGSCTSVSQESTPLRYRSSRDCGFSTKLHTAGDGKSTYLWLFCDTPLYERTLSGTYKAANPFFQTNSAGLTLNDPLNTASYTRTSMTVRHFGSSASWSEFIPRATLPNCTGYSAAWIGSAVTLPNETNATLADDPTKPATAVVLVPFQDVCVESNLTYTMHGTGLAVFRWSSTPSADPHQQFAVPNGNPAYSNGLRATILKRDLFKNPTNDFGFQYGAVVDDLGFYGKWLRVLRCHLKDIWNPPAQPKVGCEVAQVQINGNWNVDAVNLTNVDNWTYLRDPYATTNAWSHFTKDASGAGLPPNDAYDLTQSGTVTPTTYPANSPNGHTSLAWYAPKSVWVMIAMEYGYDAKAVVRTAKSITGPWSQGAAVNLPAQCNNGGCYAPSLHPQLNTNGNLGISYVVADGQNVVEWNGTAHAVQRMRYGRLPASLLPAAP